MIAFQKTVTLTLLYSLTLLYLFVSHADGTMTCLYCRRSDVTHTFLVSYSYCASSDQCLQDKWMYIDRPCSSDWIKGSAVPLMSCAPSLTTCHSFTSTLAADG